MIEIDLVDIKAYLESRDIDFKESGKNVSAGWIGMECPFCDDSSTHLGVGPKGFFNCYVCQETGSIIKLIREIERCDWREAFKIARMFFDPSLIHEEFGRSYSNKVKIPFGISRDFTNDYFKYLSKRDFNPRETIRKYRLMAGGKIGKWRRRLIIPYYLDKKLITFSARDITETSDLKYKHLPMEESVLTPKDIVYNIDNAKGRSIILCEGVTDVWRIGDGAVALSGKKLSPAQLSFLMDKQLEKVFIVLDSDAVESAETLGNQLSGVINTVEIIPIRNGDPAQLGHKDVNYIRNLII